MILLILIILIIVAVVIAVGGSTGSLIVGAQEKNRQRVKKEVKEILEGKRLIPEIERLNGLIDVLSFHLDTSGTQEEDRDLMEELRKLKRKN